MPSFDFDTGETKILNSLCDQSLKQFGASNNPQIRQAVDILSKISYKLTTFKGNKINLTKQEHEFLKKAVEENITGIHKQMSETWFGKRWLMKMMVKQYFSINSKLKKA